MNETAPQENRARRRVRRSSEGPPPALHIAADLITSALICGMILFTPWAFGTTEKWSIDLMNSTSFVLGFCLLVKWLVRWRTDYRPRRWGSKQPAAAARARRFNVGLAVCTGAFLAYGLVSAINARATLISGDSRFDYHVSIGWLPHSYDEVRTWEAFWNFLALAAFFWALHDWLSLKNAAESEMDERGSGVSILPQRVKLILWILCLNGGAVALEGVIQRGSGTSKLLWLVEPAINFQPEAQFGPYAYRGNGSQYLNLIWPLAIGLWWHAQRHEPGGRSKRSIYRLLLPAAIVMAGGSILSMSRGGAAVCVASVVAASAIISFDLRAKNWLNKAAVAGIGLIAIGLAFLLNGEKLSKRFEGTSEDMKTGRTPVYATAWEMFHDSPWLGLGPGSYDHLYQIYRTSPDQYWPGQLHNDWLETLVTFGILGAAPLFIGLALAVTRWFAGGGVQTRWSFPAFLWLSLGGCLVHARYDFPMQIFSIQMIVLIVCCILMIIGRRKLEPSETPATH